jgi:hypothetical protein
MTTAVQAGGKYSKLIGAVVGAVAGIVVAVLSTFAGIEVPPETVAAITGPLGSMLGTFFARPNG